MTRYTLKSSIKKVVRKSFFLILITCISFVVVFYYYFYYAMLEVERENINMTLNIFMDNLSGSMEKLEMQYKNTMKDFLANVYEEYKIGGFGKSKEYFEKNKFRINGDFDIFLFSPERIDYYYISPEGIVIDTSYDTDLNLDLKFYSQFWDDMKGLEEGEVFSGSLANESKTEKLRFYSYVKFDNGYSFEIGISFNNVGSDIERIMSKYISKYNTKVSMYNAEFTPLYSDMEYALSDNEMLIFIDSMDSEGFLIRKSFSHVTFYKTWHTPFGSRLIKINVEIKQVLVFLLLFSLMVVIIVLILFLIMKYVSGLSEKFIAPISELTNAMKSFWKSDKKQNIAIFSSNITEVFDIQKNYVFLMDEIKDKVEKLECANKKIMISAEENHDLIEKMDKILTMVLNIFEFENREDFFVEVFSNIFNFFEYADRGMLVTKSENGQMKIVDTYNCDISDIKGRILKCEDVKFPSGVIFSDNHVSLVASIISEKTPSNMLEILKNYGKMNFDRSIVIPIKSDKTEYGFMIMRVRQEIDLSNNTEIIKLSDFFSKLLRMYMVFSEYSEIEFAMQKDIIKSFIKILEFHDLYTKGHSENVAEIAMEIGRRLGFDSERLNELYWAGMVHDIGKVLIPGGVLNKPSPLTDDEFGMIRGHPVYAYDILSSAVSMKRIAVFVRYHHERFDGRGYPDGLSGEAIPLESRILSVADAWDSMTRDRVYRRAISAEKAVQELLINSGRQFDPDIVGIFVSEIESILK